MKNSLIVFLIILSSFFSFAGNKKVKEIEDKLKREIRTTTNTVIILEEDSGCFGKSGIFTEIKLELKMASHFDENSRSIIYHWEPVRSIFLDIDGNRIELCGL